MSDGVSASTKLVDSATSSCSKISLAAAWSILVYDSQTEERDMIQNVGELRVTALDSPFCEPPPAPATPPTSATATRTPPWRLPTPGWPGRRGPTARPSAPGAGAR